MILLRARAFRAGGGLAHETGGAPVPDQSLRKRLWMSGQRAATGCCWPGMGLETGSRGHEVHGEVGRWGRGALSGAILYRFHFAKERARNHAHEGLHRKLVHAACACGIMMAPFTQGSLDAALLECFMRVQHKSEGSCWQLASWLSPPGSRSHVHVHYVRRASWVRPRGIYASLCSIESPPRWNPDTAAQA